MFPIIRQVYEAFMTRRRYPKLDARTLKEIPDDKLEQAIVDYIHSLQESFGDEVAWRSLRTGCRAMLLTWEVDCEVNNGGFCQYYWNTQDRSSAAAVEAFSYFSAFEHASVLRDANTLRTKELAENPAPCGRNMIEAFVESRAQSNLPELDRRYFALKENLSALRIAKVRASPEEFVGT